jgi:O-antigen/teichoic acid export membrane protein
LIGSLSVIPAIASVSGTQGWAAVALGQALGTGAATVLQYGWGFIGPTQVVELSAVDQARLLWVSTLHRLVVAAVLFPVAAAAAALLAPDGHRLLAALSAVALATFGMSAYWFFVGTGRPGQAARYETVPRLVVQLAAASAARTRSR